MNLSGDNDISAERGTAVSMSRDYRRVELAIHYLFQHRREQPELHELAAASGLSPHYFQRLFRRWSGVTPKQLLGYLTVADGKALLDDRWSVLEASDELGLSGPARLHDAFVSIEAMTPGEYKNGGAGLDIRFALHPSPFGPVLIGFTARGICVLEFLPSDRETAPPAALRERLRQRWPEACIRYDPEAGADLVAGLSRGAPQGQVTLHVRGTNFQIQVWRALLALPSGTVTGYSDIARAIGRPRAQRAVGTALARNPVVWLVPCHRVLRSVTDIGQYRYGAERKGAMVAWECVRAVGEAAA
ncbi:MAG: methylated-DNA--[protein]-cysteine S-methyltransferase [Pseudomonadota bacterium]